VVLWFATRALTAFASHKTPARYDGDGQAGAAMYWTGERIDLLNS
jgi:hypothetical protein